MLGEERIRQVEAEWQELIAQVRTEMEKGIYPTSEPAQVLAQQWLDLIGEFTGGDAEIEQLLQTMYQQEGPEAASRGTMGEPEASAMWEFIGKAIERLKNS